MSARAGSIPSLDGMRAVSILLVLAAHFISSEQFPGGLGVYVFFVISGFLITRLLLAEFNLSGRISLSRFYLRRIIRLYPVIIVFTLCVTGVYMALGRRWNLLEPTSALAYFANYLYVYLDFHKIPQDMPFGPFWSLSVEEHFYILFPVAVVLLRGNPVRLTWLLAGLCAACLVLRLTVASLHPEYLASLTFYAESQYRLDSIGYGVILALACQTDRGRRILVRLAHPACSAVALAVLAACLAAHNLWFRETLRYSLLGCSIDVLTAGVLFSNRVPIVQSILNTTILVWIGRLSYSIYIWHEGVSSVLRGVVATPWLSVTANVVMTLVVATISYYGVEQPFMSLRKRLQSSRSPILPDAVGERVLSKVGT
nr:acyltransferase [uncultured Rhodopila sp.]